MNIFYREDLVMYKNELYEVEVFNIFTRHADITKDKKSYLTIHEQNLKLISRGGRYFAEEVEDFYDDCLDRYNILSYNEEKKAVIEIMELIKILECD